MFNPQPKDKDKPKQENLIPVTEYRVNFLNGSGKKNKYKAKKQVYNGVKYDSTLEAKVAEDLDWQLKSGDLIEVKRQVKIPLMVNRILICNYYIDFVVTRVDGSKKYIEAKGFETMLWKMKWKLCMALSGEIDPGAEWEVVK